MRKLEHTLHGMLMHAYITHLDEVSELGGTGLLAQVHTGRCTQRQRQALDGSNLQVEQTTCQSILPGNGQEEMVSSALKAITQRPG